MSIYAHVFIGIHFLRVGIVHIIGPEQGFTLPGVTCVCGDSHTSSEYFKVSLKTLF